tara:strand:+ start:150 stop:356 length:207 start_codon:yes stop_codon:yes gene_type:complete
MIGRIEISSPRHKIIMKHLKQQNMTYSQHLLHAGRVAARLAVCSGALFIHAVFPFILVDFASKRVEMK